MRLLFFVAVASQLVLACSSVSSGRDAGAGMGVGTGGGASATGTGTASGGTSSGGGTTSGSATTGGLAGLGTACTPGEAPDPCATYGLACDLASSTCQLPGELDECESGVGCSNAGLVCTPGFQSGDQPVSVCVYPCAATADCPDLITNCQEVQGGGHVCFVDLCAPDGEHGYFEPCPSASTDDGVCLPLFANTATEIAGVCVATGSLANGAACTGTRTDAGAAGLCMQGSNCAQFDAGTGEPFSTFCETTCYSNDEVPGGGPTCDGEVCFNFSNTNAYGSCLVSCAGDAADACPAGTGCYSFDFYLSPYSLCIPTK